MKVYARRIPDLINFDFPVSMVLRPMLSKCDQFMDKEDEAAGGALFGSSSIIDVLIFTCVFLIRCATIPTIDGLGWSHLWRKINK